MRWYSTSESARKGEPSVLAIVETLAAMGVSVWIGVRFGTWMHVFLGACIVPFLLLRTDASFARETALFQLIRDWLPDRPTASLQFMRKPVVRWVLIVLVGICLLSLPRAIYIELHDADATEPPQRGGGAIDCLFYPIGCVLLAVLMLFFWVYLMHLVWQLAVGSAVVCIRVYATATELLLHPIRSITAIPQNWWRQVATVDLALSPELLPHPRYASGPDGTTASDGFSVYESVSKVIRGTEYPVEHRTLQVGLLFPAIFCAMAYRWSIKSTAIVWFPLLWALRPMKPADRDWKTTLGIEREKGTYQLIAVVSAICLLGLACRYLWWASGDALARSMDAWKEPIERVGASSMLGKLFQVGAALVAPGEKAFDFWQVAMFFNAILGLFVWWKIKGWLAHFNHNLPPSDASIERTLRVSFFFRRLLTTYIILCDGYIFFQVARGLPIPTVGTKLTPWW